MTGRRHVARRPARDARYWRVLAFDVTAAMIVAVVLTMWTA